MSTIPDLIQLGAAVSDPDRPTGDAFDPSLFFDRWLRDVQTNQQTLVPEYLEPKGPDNSEIFIGSFPGSNCEVAFEGVLHFDGYSIGNITSPEGTLVVTRRGRIEADINVGVAVIAGSVTGNITASQHVVLESDARVTGLIQTPALSVRLGAVFDGDCVLITNKKQFGRDGRFGAKPSDELEHLAVRASAGIFGTSLRH